MTVSKDVSLAVAEAMCRALVIPLLLVVGCSVAVPPSSAEPPMTSSAGPSTGSPPASSTVSSSSAPIVEADRELFIFASGPDCFSLQLTTGQPFILRFPDGWSIEERGPAGCDGPMYESSIAAVRDVRGQLIASSGDVVRVVGERVEQGPEEWVPVFRVDSMAPSDLALPDAIDYLFRDPHAPVEFRDRSHLPQCGVVLFTLMLSSAEMEASGADPSADVRSCVWSHWLSGDSAEYLILRDGIPDTGYLSTIVRIEGGVIERLALSRHIHNEPAEWSTSVCEGLVERPSEDEAPAFETFGCEPRP